MEQYKTSTRTMLENLLRHYDIKDFIHFLVRKKFLSSLETKSLPSSKKEVIIYIINKDRFHTKFLEVLEQYMANVSDDTTAALTEIRKLSLTNFKQELACETDLESDSISSSSFSDDSDTGMNTYSQEIPTVS